MSKKVIIIGSGIAGISSSLKLKSYGVDSIIVDKGNFIGGRISTRENIASEEISFYVQGIFKIGSQEVDSATGMKMVNVSVVSAKMMHKREGKKFWKTVATVAGNQRKGKGTTYDEAINNAIRLCAQSVAKQMVQKLNAKGIK